MSRSGGLHLVEILRNSLDGPTSRACHEVARVLVNREPLAAKVTADEARVDDDLCLRQTKRRRKLLAQGGRRLVRIDNAYSILFVDPHHAGAGVDEPLKLTRRGERVLEDVVGTCKHVFNQLTRLALLDNRVAVDIGVRSPGSFSSQKRVAVNIRLEDRRVIVERIGEGDQRQLFVLDFDQSRCLFGRIPTLRRYRGDPIADHAHAVRCQRRPVEQAAAKPHRADVRPGQYRLHSRYSKSGGCIDRQDAGVRSRSACVRQPQHAWHRYVGGVTRGTRHLQRTFDTVLRLVKQWLPAAKLRRCSHTRTPPENWSRNLRSARSVQTRAIRRLYAADPRASSDGST